MIDFDLLTIIIFSVLFILACIFIKIKYKKDNIYFIFLAIMFIYFLGFIDYTIFPILLGDFESNNLSNSINFIPLKNAFNKESLFNILLTLPLGFGIPFVSSINTNKKIIILAILTDTGVELIQLLEAIIFSNGFTMRYIDINDVIFNFIGTIIGFLLLKIFARLYLKLKRENLNKLFRYIYDICKKLK